MDAIVTTNSLGTLSLDPRRDYDSLHPTLPQDPDLVHHQSNEREDYNHTDPLWTALVVEKERNPIEQTLLPKPVGKHKKTSLLLSVSSARTDLPSCASIFKLSSHS